MVIFVPNNDPTLYEKSLGRDELEEMSGLKKSRSGLPVNLWLDDSRAYIRGRHAKRVKVQNDRGNNANAGNMFSMIISKDNPWIPDDQLPKVKLNAKEINAIKAFVKNNADLLDKLADEKIDIGTFLQKMKS